MKLAFADLHKIQTDLDTLVDNSTENNRVLSKIDMGLMSEYGCWCYFQEDVGKGKSQPVNAVDLQCKILHQGYECAIIDGEEEGNLCSPWEVEYNSATGQGLLSNIAVENIREECRSRNPGADKCAQRACEVEGYFVMEIFKIFASGQALEPEYQHDVDWQPDQINCPTAEGPYSDKKCCGQYPIRSPFKTMSFDQERDCCADQVYTKLYKVCCDD